MNHAPKYPNHGHQGQRGQAFTATGAPGMRATRRVDYRAIKCPDCGAGPGEPCTTHNAHVSRKRMATRADNEARAQAGLAPEDNRARKPGTLEDPNGVYCPSCGLTIQVSPSGSIRPHGTKGNGTSRYTVPCPGPQSTEGPR